LPADEAADEAVAVAHDMNYGLEFTERRWLTVNPGPAHYPY
jgi:hypothetical protein